MSTDFLEAGERHWEDAKLLEEHHRWPNADQLYGFAAECWLKAVMRALGMALREDGAPRSRHHRVHIDRLWDEFVTFVHGYGAEELAARLGSNVFFDWHISQRYHATHTIDRSSVHHHRNGTEQVRALVWRARFDGRL